MLYLLFALAQLLLLNPRPVRKAQTRYLLLVPHVPSLFLLSLLLPLLLPFPFLFSLLLSHLTTASVGPRESP